MIQVIFYPLNQEIFLIAIFYLYQKSSKGHPGEINGAFDGNTIGNISINSQIGIYGNMSCDEFSSDNAIPVAAKEQICESDAYILSDVIGQKRKNTR